MRVKFEMPAPSKKIVNAFNSAARNFPSRMDKIVAKVAKSVLKDVKKLITSQNFENVKLTDAWVAKKRQMGLDVRTLLATRDYRKDLKVEASGRLMSHDIVGDANRAKFMEYGWNAKGTTVSPRPHWTPVLLEHEKHLTEKFGDALMAAIFGTGEDV